MRPFTQAPAVLGLVLALAAGPVWGAPGARADSAAVSARRQGGALPAERIRGIYLQQAVEFATLGARLVRLTRMTRFRRCGTHRGLPEDFNDHIVEVLGREVPGFGFVAAIVNAVEGCERQGAGRPQDGNAHER